MLLKEHKHIIMYRRVCCIDRPSGKCGLLRIGDSEVKGEQTISYVSGRKIVT